MPVLSGLFESKACILLSLPPLLFAHHECSGKYTESMKAEAAKGIFHSCQFLAE